MNKKIIDTAINISQRSTYRHRVGAVIFSKNKIISTGHNFKERSVKKLHPRFQKWPGSVHAEVMAIINAKTDLKRASILVVRVNNKNQLLLSRPCQECMKYIQYVGIKRIYYSISSYPYIIEMEQY